MSHGPLAKFIPVIIGAALFVLMLASTGSVGAAAPPNAYLANGCPVGNDVCLTNPAWQYGPNAYAPVGYGALPAGGHWIGDRYYYRDNRYCGDGDLFFQNGGYFCANGGPTYIVGSPVYPIGAPAYFTGYVVR